MKKQTYKFRAECINEVLEFMKKAKFEYDVKIAISDKLISGKDNSEKTVFRTIADFQKYFNDFLKKKLEETNESSLGIFIVLNSLCHFIPGVIPFNFFNE